MIFKLFIFWFILFFFGYQTAKWLFRKAKIEELIALSGLIGIGTYIFLTNIISYLIPIQVSFYLGLLIFFIISSILFFKNKSKSIWGIDKNWRKILLIVILLLITITSIIDNRYPVGAEYTLPPGMPSGVTIAEGNFPPKAIWTPPYPLRYHYGSYLFVGAAYKTTGLPFHISFDVQTAFSVGILFLLGFLLIKKFAKDNKKALISSLSMLYAGGLVFFKGIKGISVLYSKYILHQEMLAPFKFVFETFEARFSASTFQRMIEFPTNALGFVLMLGVIYLYLAFKKRNIILLIILLAVLALISEAFFVVICFLIFIYPFIFRIAKKYWPKKLITKSLLILVIVLPIVFVQGGVFTHYLGLDGHGLSISRLWGYTHTEFLEKGFDINTSPWVLMTRIGENNKLPIYSLEFLLQWVLLLSLVIISTIYFWEKRSKYLIFLILSFFVFFLIPLFIVFPLIYAAMERFFYPANLFGGLIVGLFLADLFFRKENINKFFFKKFIVFIFILLILQGLIFHLLFLTIGYPPGKWNDSKKLFESKNSFRGGAYQWIKKNTSIDDYFLVFEPQDKSFGVEDKSPNLRFILNTGRIAPNYTYHTDRGPVLVPEPFAFKQLAEDCNSKLLKLLNYKYIYVDEDFPMGFEEKCLQNNNLDLRFESRKGNNFIKIYKIL